MEDDDDNIDGLIMLYPHACLVIDANLDLFNQRIIFKIKFEYKNLLFVAFKENKPHSFTVLHV